MDTDRLLEYADFVVERHRVWESRMSGADRPWSTDPLLNKYKFTNVFRILDPGSQYPLQRLYPHAADERELLALCFYYRATNAPAAWEAVLAEFGGVPTIDDLDAPDYGAVLDEVHARDIAMFSVAYRVRSPDLESATRLPKRHSIRKWTHDLFTRAGLWEEFDAATTMEGRYLALLKQHNVGPFVAMQALTDYNYATGGDEDEFVAPGVGAVRGAAALDPDRPATEVLRRCHALLQSDRDCPTLEALGSDRVPSLMDVQNTLCEFAKYVHRAADASKVGGRENYTGRRVHPVTTVVLPEHYR